MAVVSLQMLGPLPTHTSGNPPQLHLAMENTAGQVVSEVCSQDASLLWPQAWERSIFNLKIACLRALLEQNGMGWEVHVSRNCEKGRESQLEVESDDNAGDLTPHLL